jgi:hypothetical protein
LPTPSGFWYWITFADDYSRYKKVHLLKHKSNAFDAFKSFIAQSERQLGQKLKQL